MVFRITSTSQRSGRAFTFVEVLVTSGLCALVFLLIASSFLFNLKSFLALRNYSDLDQKSRNALDSISKQIRCVRWLTEYSTNYLTFEDDDGTPLTFFYDPDAKTLTRTKNGVTDAKPLLSECDFLQFDIFQRNHSLGTFDQYPTAMATNCKLVQLTWVCSRKILGTKFNTESVQSAKVVIRRR